MASVVQYIGKSTSWSLIIWFYCICTHSIPSISLPSLCTVMGRRCVPQWRWYWIEDPFLCFPCTHERRIGPSPKMAISVQGQLITVVVDIFQIYIQLDVSCYSLFPCVLSLPHLLPSFSLLPIHSSHALSIFHFFNNCLLQHSLPPFLSTSLSYVCGHDCYIAG